MLRRDQDRRGGNGPKLAALIGAAALEKLKGSLRNKKGAPNLRGIPIHTAGRGGTKRRDPVMAGLQSANLQDSYAPVSSSRGVRGNAPRFVSRSNSGVRIVHREFIANISSSQNFTVAATFALNPGIAATFPWLSTQASCWEQYKFHNLKFCYYTRSPTSAGGSVLLVPDYDASDAAPFTEQIATSYADIVEEVPWTTTFCCKLSAKAMLGLAPRKYIRTNTLAANLDIKTYDSGNLFICTTDGTSSVINWGKIWVEYDVELFIPQLPPSGGALATTQHLFFTTPVSSDLFPPTAVQSIGPTLCTFSSNVVTFTQSGTYLVSILLSATTSNAISVITAANGATLNAGVNAGEGFFISSTNAELLTATIWLTTTVGGTLTFTASIVSGISNEMIITTVNALANAY